MPNSSSRSHTITVSVPSSALETISILLPCDVEIVSYPIGLTQRVLVLLAHAIDDHRLTLVYLGFVHFRLSCSNPVGSVLSSRTTHGHTSSSFASKSADRWPQNLDLFTKYQHQVYLELLLSDRLQPLPGTDSCSTHTSSVGVVETSGLVLVCPTRTPALTLPRIKIDYRLDLIPACYTRGVVLKWKGNPKQTTASRIPQT